LIARDVDQLAELFQITPWHGLGERAHTARPTKGHGCVADELPPLGRDLHNPTQVVGQV
jgi:hypothetical protein